jgi:kynurenine/2-aminoadipate aminotransferase
MKFNGVPGLINLAGGMPNMLANPIVKCDFTLRDGTQLTFDKKQHFMAFQYGPSQGNLDFIALLKQYMCLWHNKVESKQWDICVTTGSQDGLSKTFDMLCNEGDSIILGAPGYPGTLANLHAKNIFISDVPTDKEGVDVDAIENLLVNWETLHPEKKKPRIVYVIPVGSNPSGSTLTLARKQHLIRLASEHNLLILEDDPYYFMTYEDDTEETLAAPASDKKAWNAPTSLFELDTEGRVLRFDSFSKILSAGMRVGFVTGPTPLTMRIMLHNQASVLHCSAFTQMMALVLLQHQGQEGFLQHIRSVRAFYRSQRDALVAAATEHLTGLCTFNVPSSGMFLWLTSNEPDTWNLIMNGAQSAGILMIPGQTFSIDNTASNCLRASFSMANPSQLAQAMERLAGLLRSAAADRTAQKTE